MRPATAVLGCGTVALVVFSVGLAISRMHVPRLATQDRETMGDPTRPEPPLADLPRDLPTMSDVEASAYLFVDDHLFTRFDSARAVKDLPCDEGMPDRLAFAADGRVLGASRSQSRYDVRVELVTVGSAVVSWNGCTLESASVTDSVHTDTVHVYLRRTDGRWEPDYEEVVSGFAHVPLAGPLYGIAGADWSALAARADSIRKARGSAVARMRKPVPATHFLQETGDNLRYPQDVQRPCAASAPAPVKASFAQLGFVDPEYAPNLQTMSGDWWAIYEPNDSAGRTCIAPVRLKFAGSVLHYCNQRAPADAGLWSADGYEQRPLFLVRDVQGLRTGAHGERFSFVTVPGWNRGLLVYSDTGEVLRVTESREGAGGYQLTAQYRGQDYGIARGSPGETWGIYWAGALNGDSIPDFVLRTTTAGEHEIQHRLTLLVSHPERKEGLWIPESSNTVVRFCR
jgi:hypothetical protein